MLNDSIGQKNENFDRYKDRLTKFSSEFELGLFILIAKKSLIWIFIFFSISIGSIYLYLRYTQPIFESRATIQLTNSNKANDILQVGQPFENNNKLAEAIEVLKSQVFLQRVVKKLNLSVSYLNEGTFKNYELYTSSPFVVDVKIKNESWYNSKIYIEFDENAYSGKIKIGDKNPLSIPFKLNEWVRNKDIEFSIVLNKNIENSEAINSIRRLEKPYFICNTESGILSYIQSKIDVKIVNEQSQSISVSVMDFVPSKAADIANAVVEEYQIYGVEKESEGSKNILAFIDAQLNNVFYDLKASENNIESFQKSNNYISNNVAKSTSISRFSTVEDQLLKLELDEMILSELQKNLQNNKSIDTYQLISLLAGTEEESSIRSITNELQKLLIEKENLLYLVTPNSDAIKQANFQIETQKKLLIESLSSYRNKTKFKYQNLKEKSNKLAAEFEPQPDKDMEYSRLMRLFSINEKYYTLLLEKKTEFSISRRRLCIANQSYSKKQTSPASSPVSPSKKTRNNHRITYVHSCLVSL
jgi:tyrosine-protein kinase Etk/Wzc